MATFIVTILIPNYSQYLQHKSINICATVYSKVSLEWYPWDWDISDELLIASWIFLGRPFIVMVYEIGKQLVVVIYLLPPCITGQVGLGVGSWPSNRATEGSNPKWTRLYFVILLKNVEKIFDWHWYNRLKDALMCR